MGKQPFRIIGRPAGHPGAVVFAETVEEAVIKAGSPVERISQHHRQVVIGHQAMKCSTDHPDGTLQCAPTCAGFDNRRRGFTVLEVTSLTVYDTPLTCGVDISIERKHIGRDQTGGLVVWNVGQPTPDGVVEYRHQHNAWPRMAFFFGAAQPLQTWRPDIDPAPKLVAGELPV